MQALRQFFVGSVAVVIAAVVSLVLGFFATLMLLPLWRWLESAHGVEAIGHSGPADWCYTATTVAVFIPISAIAIHIAFRSRAASSGP
jgi:hypothetical protein